MKKQDEDNGDSLTIGMPSGLSGVGCFFILFGIAIIIFVLILADTQNGILKEMISKL